MILPRRLAALAAVLALSVGNIAVCAGWQLTPDARMACCMSETGCPMHKPDGHDHSSKRSVTQKQADSCCAASTERRDSSAAASVFASSGAIALLPTAVFSVVRNLPVAGEWRAPVPLPLSSVPKHLLFSVLLV